LREWTQGHDARAAHPPTTPPTPPHRPPAATTSQAACSQLPRITSLSRIASSAGLMIGKAVEASARARDECRQAIDETFRDLEGAVTGARVESRYDARLAARALVVKGARAAARLRAAVEGLEAEATLVVEALDQLVSTAQAMREEERKAGRLRSCARVDALSLELSELEVREVALEGARSRLECQLVTECADRRAAEDRAAEHVAKLTSAEHRLEATRAELADAHAEICGLERCRELSAAELHACRESHALEVSAVTSAHQAEIAELTDCLSVLLARVADEQRRRQGAEERAEAHEQARRALDALHHETERELRDEVWELRSDLQGQIELRADLQGQIERHEYHDEGWAGRSSLSSSPRETHPASNMHNKPPRVSRHARHADGVWRAFEQEREEGLKLSALLSGA